MKVRIEILRWNHRGEPIVLGAIQHESHSLDAVASAAQGVIDSGELPGKVDGFRIVTENGSEFFGWRDLAADLFETATANYPSEAQMKVAVVFHPVLIGCLILAAASLLF